MMSDTAVTVKKKIFTVLGAGGFIGSALVNSLRFSGHEVVAPNRQATRRQILACLEGNVIYCVGLTADFRERPWDTLDAHVNVLREVLNYGNFESLTYLSSARVYLGCDSGHEESALKVQPANPDQLYNLSKLMGESLCHVSYRCDRPVRVVRLSNVVGNDPGSDNFINSLLREAIETGCINLKSDLDSKKDYIALSDVTRILELIASVGKARCYNLASGIQISHRDVIDAIINLTGAVVNLTDDAPCVNYPHINIDRIVEEFGYIPTHPLALIG